MLSNIVLVLHLLSALVVTCNVECCSVIDIYALNTSVFTVCTHRVVHILQISVYVCM